MYNVHTLDDYLPRPWQRLFVLRLGIRRTLVSPFIAELYGTSRYGNREYLDLYRSEVTGDCLPITGTILALSPLYPGLERAQVIEIYITPPGAFGYQTGHAFTVHAVLKQKKVLRTEQFIRLISEFDWSVLERKLQ